MGCTGGTGATAATYFDSSFCNDGIRRLLLCNTATAISVAGAQVPQWHMIMARVHTPIHGGGGGQVATFSMAPVPTRSASMKWVIRLSGSPTNTSTGPAAASIPTETMVRLSSRPSPR